MIGPEPQIPKVFAVRRVFCSAGIFPNEQRHTSSGEERTLLFGKDQRLKRVAFDWPRHNRNSASSSFIRLAKGNLAVLEFGKVARDHRYIVLSVFYSAGQNRPAL